MVPRPRLEHVGLAAPALVGKVASPHGRPFGALPRAELHIVLEPDESPEAGEPMREHQGHHQEAHQRRVRVREADVVLPAREDARRAHDACELHDAEHAEQSQRQRVALRALAALASRLAEKAEEHIERDAGNHVQDEPAPQVVVDDASLVVHPHAAALGPEGQKEGEAHIGDEDGVDEAVDHESDRPLVPVVGGHACGRQEGDLPRRDEDGDHERGQDHKVPPAYEARVRVDRPLVCVSQTG